MAEKEDEFWMQEAVKEAYKALDADEVPIGAVVVCGGKIIARAFNMTETLQDVTAHAEMQAFTAAAADSGGKYLRDCTLYVTLQPCPMCAGAAYWTQIGRVVYGATDQKHSNIDRKPLFHPRTEVTGGVLEQECMAPLKLFFARKRRQQVGK
ncbi:MAG: nucleoside deaminase [Bacteroidales bacterium]|jgi:tRNA(adenine34) deaminase|nr:nucleoside deaminase [Bacteroidales bacterium]MBR4340740.1 nucleoside deaminase [Bacteroidales bacterium]